MSNTSKRFGDVAGFCTHHYARIQGFYYCTKCGHRTYIRSRGSRQLKLGITVVVLVAIVGYFSIIGLLTFNENHMEDSINGISQNFYDTSSNTQKVVKSTFEPIKKTLSSQIEKIQNTE